MQLYSDVSQDVQFQTGTNLLRIEPNELLQWARRSACGANRIRELFNERAKYEIPTWKFSTAYAVRSTQIPRDLRFSQHCCWISKHGQAAFSDYLTLEMMALQSFETCATHVVDWREQVSLRHCSCVRRSERLTCAVVSCEFVVRTSDHSTLCTVTDVFLLQTHWAEVSSVLWVRGRDFFDVMARYRHIPVTNTWGWSAVVSCEFLVGTSDRSMLWPVTDVFLLQIHGAEVQLCLVSSW